jgi:hypothetical protein
LTNAATAEDWTVGAEAGYTLVEGVTGVAVPALKKRKDVAGLACGREGLTAGGPTLAPGSAVSNRTGDRRQH